MQIAGEVAHQAQEGRFASLEKPSGFEYQDPQREAGSGAAWAMEQSGFDFGWWQREKMGEIPF